MNDKHLPKRGDVFYIRFDRGWGSEEAVGRPVVVVGAHEGTPLYNCLYMTTTPKNIGTAVPLTTPLKKSWALVNQLYTFDIARFKDRLCTLTEKEMSDINTVLAATLGLSMRDESEEERLRAEVETLKAEIAELKETQKDMELRCRVEADVSKKLYEKALEMLAAERLARGVAEPQEETRVETPEEEPQEELVDINRCTETALRKLGFTPAVARSVVAARPFLFVEDLRFVQGVTRIAYNLVESRVTVGDTEEYRAKPEPVAEEPKREKVNVNRATPEEMQKIGMGVKVALNIRAYRNKHGRFASIQELLNVKGFGKRLMSEYGDLLEV